MPVKKKPQPKTVPKKKVGKRSPTAHRTPEQVRAHGRGYQATPEQIAKRSQRNKARTIMEKKGKVKKGDGKDVDHKTPIKKGGGNGGKNLRVQTKKKNRGHGTSPGGTKSTTKK